MTEEDLTYYYEDFIGKRFGKLTVKSIAEDGHYKKNGKTYKTRRWNCVCDCGGVATCYESSLKSGNSTSCGCK